MAETALVLGGGGLTGIGWEAGVLAGLVEAGADPGAADVVIGTSAGSVVGAQLTSGSVTPEELYERQLADPRGEVAGRVGPAVMSRYALAAFRSRDTRAFGRRMGGWPSPPGRQRARRTGGRSSDGGCSPTPGRNGGS